MAQDATTLSSLKIDLDLTDLDAAIEKADRLKATLEEIKALQAEVRGGTEGEVLSRLLEAARNK